MANTITVGTVKRGRRQSQDVALEMWTVNATIDDQDAIAINDTLALSVTVAGLALGDIVQGSVSVDLSDGTDQAALTFAVTAANTLTLYVHADKGEFAADALNGAVMKALVIRPNW